jgi:hypothetical protein
VDAASAGVRRPVLLVFVSLLLVLGVGGILFLNIQIQDLSFEYRGLQTSVQMLGYQEAELRVAVNAERSTATLVQRASLLGMVPYPYPAVINLADGTISGDLRAANYWDLPKQIWQGQVPAPGLPKPEVIPAPKPSTQPTPTVPPTGQSGDGSDAGADGTGQNPTTDDSTGDTAGGDQ